MYICNSLSSDPPPPPPPDPRHGGVVPDEAWVSEGDLFDQIEADSMGSVQSSDRSIDNIIQKKSRVSSQENGASLLSLGKFHSV